MNSVGIVPVRDFITNVATAAQLNELERLIQIRRSEDSQQGPQMDPMAAVREMATQSWRGTVSFAAKMGQQR